MAMSKLDSSILYANTYINSEDYLLSQSTRDGTGRFIKLSTFHPVLEGLVEY